MLRDVKKDFPIFTHQADLAYLDSAATAQVPQSVLTSMYEFDATSRANIHRGIYELSEHATDLYENARAKVATFIEAGPEEIIFTSGSTDALNKLTYMFEHSPSVGRGNQIVATVMDHHSALIPFQELARRKGYTFSLIGMTESHDVEMQVMRTCITEETRIVVVTLASNVLGTINDVRAIARHAHSVGALVIVDAAQAVGHIPVSVKDLDCDFLVFSGHKMCGPMGIGVLFGKKELLKVLYPGSFGGGMVADVEDTHATFTEPPYRFEDGTRNVTGAIGLGEAISYLSAITVEEIQSHTEELLLYTIDALEAVPGVHLFTQREVKRNVGIVSFTLDGIHPHDIAEICARENVAVRAGHQCALPLMKRLGVPGVIRVSLYCYTTRGDIDRLVEAIKKVQTIFS